MNSYNGFSPTQRQRALRWLNGEYAAGRRSRPTSCQACGQTEGLLEAHSEDYSGPPFGANIGQFGLCYRCHMMVHSRFRARRAFELYAHSIDLGRVWPAIETRNWYAVQTMLGMDPDVLAMVAQDDTHPRGDVAELVARQEWKQAGGSPVISYTIIFDDEDQQKAWGVWLRDLRKRFPELETHAARIAAAIEPK